MEVLVQIAEREVVERRIIRWSITQLELQDVACLLLDPHVALAILIRGRFPER